MLYVPDTSKQDLYGARSTLYVDPDNAVADPRLPANFVLARDPGEFDLIKQQDKNLLVNFWEAHQEVSAAIDSVRYADLPTPEINTHPGVSLSIALQRSPIGTRGAGI